MRKLLWPVCLLPLLVAPSFAAEEKNSETIADIRCAVVGFKLAQAPDSSQKSAGMLLAIYYMGRLDGRNPKLDLESLILHEVDKMNDAAFHTEATRCGNILTMRGQQLSQIGEHLAAHDQQMQKDQTPSK